jgi:hypothetical protein
MTGRFLKIALLTISLFGAATSLPAPQVPALDIAVRNDATTPVTFEFRDENGDWKKITLEAGKDATLSGDRLRVTSSREDGATITVELPVELRKKYRVNWNNGARFWDFTRVA